MANVDYEDNILKNIFKISIIALLSHWLFQGYFYVDRTERFFKISLEIMFILLTFSFINISNSNINIINVFIIAHSLSFIFNCQPWVSLKNSGMVKSNVNSLINYIDNLTKRAYIEPSIDIMIVCGSKVREEGLKVTSDIDIRFVRRKGVLNGLRACVFLMKERIYSTIYRIPLDAYVLDSIKPFSKLRDDENIEIRLDRMGILFKENI